MSASTGEALFAHIEKIQGGEPWGSVLDAGTGKHSLDWVSSLAGTTRWVAVTADPARQKALRKTFADRMRPDDRVACGRWSDPALLHGEVFDVVLVDYLIGAIDYFEPYTQDLLLERLRRHVGSRVHVVGLEPYREDDPSPAARIVLDVARLRDACILLAGHRCYRELPLEWTLRHLERSGYVVEDATVFPIVYGPKFVNDQLDVCVKKLPLIEDPELATTLERRIAKLREEALAYCERHRGIRFGEDYVVSARRRGV